MLFFQDYGIRRMIFASRSLDVFVTRLRKLFADDERIQIKTVKGVGLCLSDKG